MSLPPEEPPPKKSRATVSRRMAAYRDALSSQLDTDSSNVSLEESSSSMAMEVDIPSELPQESNIIETDSCLSDENEENEVECHPPHPSFDDDIIDENIEEKPFAEMYYSQPLYDGSRLSIVESLLAVMTLAITHSLTGSCIADILVLLEMHCLKPNLCETSLYLYQKFFKRDCTPVFKHYYCSVCHDNLSEETSCSKDACLRNNCKKSFFIQMSITSQLQSLLKRPGFVNDLQYRDKRKKKNSHNFEDIYDGSVYKTLLENGILGPNSFSFMWFCDGVSAFKSSKHELWNLYLVINELPYRKRFLYENMLLAGVWFGFEKPNTNLFVEPISKEIQELIQGKQFQTPTGPVNYKFHLLCGTCDMPAKSCMLNISLFNSRYGCPRCYNPGKIISVSDRGHVTVFPHEECNRVKKRTHEETRELAKQAHETKTTVFGVKGPSHFLRLHTDIIKCIAIDVMHAVFLGCVKKLLHLWFDPSHHKRPFSLSKVVKVVDSRLQNLKPPNLVKRMPRTIRDNLKFFKASELKVWFFYYSIPILRDILKPVYLEHYVKLVTGVYLLCKESVSDSDITTAETLLYEFVKDLPSLYDERYLTINFHQLCHLPDVCRSLGPLWVTSCFFFEDFNGKLLNMVHGTNQIELQMCTALSSLYQWSLLKCGLDETSLVRPFCDVHHKRSIKFSKPILPGIICVGKITPLLSSSANVQATIANAGFQSPESIEVFLRISMHGVLLSSETYEENLKTCSSTVKFHHENSECYGTVLYYFNSLKNNACETYAVISQLAVEPEFTFPQFIKICKRSPNVCFVQIQDIVSVCFKVDVEDKCYVIEPVNTLESE